MLKSIIFSEDTVFKENLKNAISRIKYLQVNIIESISIEDLMRTEYHNIFDLIFIDTGLKIDDTIAKKITKNQRKAQIVLIIESLSSTFFELAEVKYISKTFSFKDIQLILQSILDNINLNSNTNTCPLKLKDNISKLAVHKGLEINLINTTEILYIYSESNRVLIVIDKNQVFSCRHTLNQLEEKLCGSNFFRCHRGYIVNLQKVIRVEPYFNSTYMLFFCKDIKGVPVGRSYIKEFKDIVYF